MYKKIVEFRPSISSENNGDLIIQFYISQIMQEIFGEHLTVSMPTRSFLTDRNLKHLKSADYAFVCGTNLLASNMNKRRQWDLKKIDMFRLHDLILMGVGWWQYQDNPNLYTQIMLSKILHKNALHSVRDSYTEQKLRSIGINNVINTACPTMWGLNENFCKQIPTHKSRRVVTTLTNYKRKNEADKFLIEILLKNYDMVYIWLQALEDIDQIINLRMLEKVKIVPPSLTSYENLLLEGDIDYVGTRLHGGIYALNHGVRSLIIALDNRAVEISRDTNLPVMQWENVETELENYINTDTATTIKLPTENIRKWKNQFSPQIIGGGIRK